jgi:predicted Rdx family selenoprotein
LNANGIDAEAIVGQTSQFDVVRDGELVFSKQQQGRFPEHDEILRTLRR